MKRRALFIGVDEYDDPQIRNLRFSRIDAHSLNELFADIGYDVKYLPNPTKAEVFASVRERTSGLAAGDSFLFYFAGHGFTQGGHDLIFCRDDVYEDLRYDDAGLKFDKLRMRTESNGAAYDRVFILDACRSDFLTGTRGAATYARDLVAVKELVKDVPKTGSLAVLRSCSPYQYALEIESRQHGLFTCALLDVMRTARRDGTRLAFDESFGDAVAKTMAGIAREANLTATQTPDFAKSVGCAAHVLLEGRVVSSVQSGTASVVTNPSCFEQTTEVLPRPATAEMDVVEMFRMFARAKCEREQVALLPGVVKTEFAKDIRDIEEDFAAAEDAKSCAANEAAAALVARVLAKIKALKVKVEERRAKAEAEHCGVQLWAGGPYWAECNVGATRPEEAGYYFWWGDTVGYKRNSSAKGWVSVKNGRAFLFNEENCPTYGKGDFQLKSGGYLDSYGNLTAKYDAATAHWGAPWRMPTDAEIKVLEDRCDIEWTMRNGVAGQLVRGRGDYSSRSIFLPAAGFGDDSCLDYIGLLGEYWSSTLCTGNSGDAWYLDVFSDHFVMFNGSRYRGQSVRPVQGFVQ